MNARKLLGIALALAACAGVPSHAAEPFPDRPIRLVIGSAPGSGPDIISRVLSERLYKSWGQRIVVDVDRERDALAEDLEARRTAFDTVLDPYVPLKVWKAIVRIAIAFLEEGELDDFRWIRQVVTKDERDEQFRAAPPVMCRLYWSSYPGAGVLFDPVEVEFYKRRTETTLGSDGEEGWVPSKTLVLKFGRFVWQVFLFSEKDLNQMDGRTWIFPPYPVGLARNLFEEFGDVEFADYHLCSLDAVEAERRRVEYGWKGEPRLLSSEELRALGYGHLIPPDETAEEGGEGGGAERADPRPQGGNEERRDEPPGIDPV